MVLVFLITRRLYSTHNIQCSVCESCHKWQGSPGCQRRERSSTGTTSYDLALGNTELHTNTLNNIMLIQWTCPTL